MQWLNEPASWQRVGDELTVTVDPDTDFWCETGYGYVHDNGHVYGEVLPGDLDVTVRIRGSFATQYDQAGIMLRADDRTWLKTGVECFEGRPRLSTVLTLGQSSWAVADLPGWAGEITLRAARRGDAVEVRYALGDGEPELAALVFMPADVGLLAGVTCAAPEGLGFRVVFSDLRVTDRTWAQDGEEAAGWAGPPVLEPLDLEPPVPEPPVPEPPVPEPESLPAAQREPPAGHGGEPGTPPGSAPPPGDPASVARDSGEPAGDLETTGAPPPAGTADPVASGAVDAPPSERGDVPPGQQAVTATSGEAASTPGDDGVAQPSGGAPPAPGGDALPAPGGGAPPAPGGDALPAPGGDAVPQPAGDAVAASEEQAVPSSEAAADWDRLAASVRARRWVVPDDGNLSDHWPGPPLAPAPAAAPQDSGGRDQGASRAGDAPAGGPPAGDDDRTEPDLTVVRRPPRRSAKKAPPIDLPAPQDPADEWISLLTADPEDE